MRILVIDNKIDRDSWGSQDLARFGKLAPGATVCVRRAPEGDLPKSPSAFDRVIVSGSKTSAMEDAPWISELQDFIRRAIDLGKPLLGVCYGHQTLARALGGKDTVRLAKQAEWGWTKIEILGESPLLQGLSREFYSLSSHSDEVCRLPAGLKHLARSADCEIQAVQLEGRPVFGIQFHPEKELESAKRYFAEKKRAKFKDRLLHPTESDRLFDPKIGETIFGNFLGNLPRA